MSLVALTPAHAEVVAALHELSFAAPLSAAWSAAEFAALLSQPGVAGWVMNAGQPQGFILVRAVADEAEILTLAVTPDVRRQGIADALVGHASAVLAAGGTQRFFLEVAADNAPAIALYTKHAFETTGRRRGYYARGAASVDAILMARTLS